MIKENLNTIDRTPLNFVIGKERSGTTLLQVMLNSHPNIVAPPESRFIVMFYYKYGLIKTWSKDDIRSFCNDLFVEKIFEGYWNINKEELYNSLIQVNEELTYPLLCKLVFYYFDKTSKNIKLLVDKNPLYYYFLPELNEVFPSAKYIHIVRDYRANILSHKRVVSVNLSMADMAYRWLKVNENIEKIKMRSPQQWLTIKYESLVTDTETTMQQICSFFNIPYDKGAIEEHYTKLFPSFYEMQDSAEFNRFHGKVFEPVKTSFIDEWKNEMKEKDISVAELIAGQFAEKTYGYKKYLDRKEFKLSKVKMFAIKLKYSIISEYLHALLKYRWVYFMHRGFLRYILQNDKGGNR